MTGAERGRALPCVCNMLCLYSESYEEPAVRFEFWNRGFFRWRCLVGTLECL